MIFLSRGLHFFTTSANVRGMKKHSIFLKIIGGIVVGCLMTMAGGPNALAEEELAVMPELYFKSINPGYVIDGINNVGEMFEIARGGGSDELISLASVTVRYTNTSGKETVLVEFPENSYLAGETLLLRLASSPESGLANFTYKKTLAMSAKLTIMRGEEILDTVCWTGKDGCMSAFLKDAPTTLIRNLSTGKFDHVNLYEPNYNEKNFKEESDEEFGELKSQCKNLQFSEILSYYAETQSEQFVELYNAGSEQILLDGCALRYKNKLYPLSGIVKPEGYYVRLAEDFKLTKNPTNFGTLEIIDTDETVVDKLDYPNGQRKGVPYAMIGYDEKGNEVWHTTYAMTPGEPNIYQEFKTCETGKVINEETGNCVKVTEITEKTCEVGQYLNPLTGRCKKIEVPEEKVCKEGYYFYEPTGRCRKIIENDGAEYNLNDKNKYEEKSSFVAVYAVIGVVGFGLIYIFYEYRKEILRFLKRFLLG